MRRVEGVREVVNYSLYLISIAGKTGVEGEEGGDLFANEVLNGGSGGGHCSGW